MGQSTDAIMFYGYCWTEETSRPWTIGSDDDAGNDDDDWEERYARAKGETPPALPFPERPYPLAGGEPAWTAEERAVVESHRAHWERKRKLVEASGCKVDTHCSGECPMPYVAIAVSEIRSWRGHMNQITSLDVKLEWQPMLDEFCRALGIKTEGLTVGWWLVSNWS